MLGSQTLLVWRRPHNHQPARNGEIVASLEPNVASSGYEDDKAKKAMEDAQQMQAKLSVTQATHVKPFALHQRIIERQQTDQHAQRTLITGSTQKQHRRGFSFSVLTQLAEGRNGFPPSRRASRSV